MGTIEGFSIRIDERQVRIRRAIDLVLRDEQSPFDGKLTKRGQVVVESYLAQPRSCYKPRDGMSVYSSSFADMLKRFSRGPRCGLLKDYKGLVVGFDVCKAYTECMRRIKEIPVFSGFDVMVPCARDADIDPLSFYHVNVRDFDLI